jgi:hypothetical protein
MYFNFYHWAVVICNRAILEERIARRRALLHVTGLPTNDEQYP